MTERAGYEIRTLEPGPASRCGGCGAEILPGEAYGYNTTGMMICSECIEVFELGGYKEPCEACSTGTLAGPIPGALSNGERCDTCQLYPDDAAAQATIRQHEQDVADAQKLMGGI